MTAEEFEIREIVNRETKAWDTQDVSLLINAWHQRFGYGNNLSLITFL